MSVWVVGVVHWCVCACCLGCHANHTFKNKDTPTVRTGIQKGNGKNKSYLSSFPCIDWHHTPITTHWHTRRLRRLRQLRCYAHTRTHAVTHLRCYARTHADYGPHAHYARYAHMPTRTHARPYAHAHARTPIRRLRPYAHTPITPTRPLCPQVHYYAKLRPRADYARTHAATPTLAHTAHDADYAHALLTHAPYAPPQSARVA